MTDPILPLRAGRPSGPSPLARTLATIAGTAAVTVGAGLLAYRLSPRPPSPGAAFSFPPSAAEAAPRRPAAAELDGRSSRVLAFAVEALDAPPGRPASPAEAAAAPAPGGEEKEPDPRATPELAALVASAGPVAGGLPAGLRDALASAPAATRTRGGASERPSYAAGRLVPFRGGRLAPGGGSPRRRAGPPSPSGSLRRLARMQAAMAPTRSSEDAEGSSRVHAEQYEGAEAALDLDARPIDLSGRIEARVPDPPAGGPIVEPSSAGTPQEAPPRDPYAVAPAGLERNVTPYQRLIDAATKLMAAAGLLLMGAGLLVWLGRKLQNSPTPWTRALGRGLIAAGTAMAYAALALGAAVTALGVAILASGQKLQGLIFTASGAALTYAAYRAAQGDRRAHQEAQEKERAIEARNREEAARRLESRLPADEPMATMEPHGVEVSDTMARVEPVRSELPTQLDLKEPPPIESVTSNISYPSDPAMPGGAAGAAPGNGLSGPPSWATNRYDGEIAAAANRHGLDPRLLKAVVQTESSGNPLAVGSSGERGLMQLMPGTARQLGVANPFDPLQSLDGGARLLSQYLRQYGGDLTRALGAYNAGPGNVARGFIPAGYVRNVLTNLGQIGRP